MGFWMDDMEVKKLREKLNVTWMVTCLGTWLLCYSFVSIQFLVAISTLATIEVEIAHWNFTIVSIVYGEEIWTHAPDRPTIDWIEIIYTPRTTKKWGTKFEDLRFRLFFSSGFLICFLLLHTPTNDKRKKKNFSSLPREKNSSLNHWQSQSKRMVILLLLFSKWRRRGRKRRRRGAIVGSCEVPHGSTWTECRQSGTSRRDS